METILPHLEEIEVDLEVLLPRKGAGDSLVSHRRRLKLCEKSQEKKVVLFGINTDEKGRQAIQHVLYV